MKTIWSRLYLWMPCLLVWLGVSWFYPHPNFMSPDSESYIQFAPMRTFLYPYTLWAFKDIFGSYESVIPFQLFTYCFSFGVLGEAVRRFTKKGWMGFLMVLAGLANIFNYPEFVLLLLTDSFFSTLLVLFFSLLLFYFDEKKISYLAGMSVLVGIGICLRPVSYALVPLFLFILSLSWPALRQRLKSALAAILVPILFFSVLQSHIHERHHGPDKNDLLGLTLFAKAAMMERAPPAEYPAPKFGTEMLTLMQPKLDSLDTIPNSFNRFNTYRDIEGWAQYRYPPEHLRQGTAEANMSSVGDFMFETGKAYIKAYPLSYLKNALYHDFGSWIIFDEREPSLLQFLIRSGILLIGATTLFISVGGVLLILWRGHSSMPESWKPVFLASLFMHGYTLLIGLSCIAVSRYLSAAWGPLIIAAGLPSLMILEWMFLRFSMAFGLSSKCSFLQSAEEPYPLSGLSERNTDHKDEPSKNSVLRFPF